MKTTLPVLAIFLLSLLFQTATFAQISVSSTNGYSVNIVVQPKSIVTNTNDCTWGYTYNVKLNYHINFSGPNQPAALYTMQGSIGCGSSSHFFDLPNGAGTGTIISQSNVWNSSSNCGTATISNLSCMVVAIDIEGPGISARTVTFTATEAALPIKLVDFSTIINNNRVQLNWATATEINNQLFTIERSSDGTNWDAIKTIKGAGNSNVVLNYSTFDDAPLQGTSYYRLKQTDFDSKSTFSDTRVVKFNGVTSIGVYPVPNSGNTVTFKGITEPKATTVSVRDLAGVTVFTGSLSSATIQFPALKAGLYVIALKNNTTGETSNLRYVKI